MTIRPFALVPFLVPLLAALPGVAQEAEVPADVLALYEGLRLPAIIGVMAEEGQVYGDTLAASLFAGESVPTDWERLIEGIYDPDRIRSEVLATLSAELEGDDVAAMRAFFEAEPGRSLAGLELAAREAMLDEDVEQSAREAAAVAMAEGDPRLDLLRRYATANDLIETNVVGAMNSNAAYFMGLIDGGAMAGDMTESDVIADVWSQEEQIRGETTEWLYSFLLMAYGPASDADVEALIAFSESEPGQDLNRAVFAAFDESFEGISRALGLASARYMTSEQL